MSTVLTDLIFKGIMTMSYLLLVKCYISSCVLTDLIYKGIMTKHAPELFVSKFSEF